jgi:hypothetical protein
MLTGESDASTANTFIPVNYCKCFQTHHFLLKILIIIDYERQKLVCK